MVATASRAGVPHAAAARNGAVALAVLGGVGFAGCSARPDHGAAPTLPPSGTVSAGACQVTAPMPSDQVPETLRRTQPGQHWYGSGALWIGLPPPAATVRGSGESSRVKYPSATLDAHGAMAPGAGAPHVSARLVGGSSVATSGTGGYATAFTSAGQRISWWPTVIDVPRPGCWMVTETLGDTVVRFVMSVS